MTSLSCWYTFADMNLNFMTQWRATSIVFAAALLFGGLVGPRGDAQEATPIKVHCQITNPHGASLLEQYIVGEVRFFGGNFKAT